MNMFEALKEMVPVYNVRSGTGDKAARQTGPLGPLGPSTVAILFRPILAIIDKKTTVKALKAPQNTSTISKKQ